MRLPIVAANWKMHSPPKGWDAPDSPYRNREGVDVVVFPTFVDLANAVAAGLVTGAQYGEPEPEGAFTGDIGMTMLSELGCRFVLCGHSERRSHHHETDEMVAAQVRAAIAAGLTPILCIGETADERAAGKANEVVEHQLSHILSAKTQNFACLVLAYEPVWAIGTGNTATPEDAQQMHATIRSLLPDIYKEDIRILYGGSVKAGNASDLIAQPDIDGFLVGASSLDPTEFREIVKIVAAHEAA